MTFTKPHYTELNKGQLWLMASGEVAHLIGTQLLGDASFLFKYTDGTLIQTYPGLPGCKDQPIKLWKIIQDEINNKTKESIDSLISSAAEEITAQLIDQFKSQYKDTIGMSYDRTGKFIGYISNNADVATIEAKLATLAE